MRLFLQIFLYFILTGTFAATLNAAQLTISYFERPPYYLTNKAGEADGFLVQKTKEILKLAKIDAHFVSMTPNNIIYVIQHAKRPHCSIGWFKKPDRELFAKFTHPIYRSPPLVLLTRKSNENQFKKYHSLKEIFADKQLIMARMSSFSYGSYVDHLMNQYPPVTLFLSGSQSALLRAVATGKASYLVIAPEEVDNLISSAELPRKEFVQIPLADIPHGNNRYLMCNPAVSDKQIMQLNSAIDKLSKSKN